jgi:hypothetical protein
MVRRLVALCVLGLVASGLWIATAATASADPVRIRLVRAIRTLPVATENRAGYDRTKFRLWVDADRDCRDTRDEVLATESLVPVHGCDIQRGRWRSYYDGVVTRASAGFDIDHLVPLAEAWDSGARAWTSGTRERYANDLADTRTLVAVTASSNRSKSDRDPADWMPRLGRCLNVRQWVAVKIRWQLKVDTREKQALLSQASRCADAVLTVRRAGVAEGTPPPATPTPAPAPAPTPAPAPAPAGTDPRFDYCYEAIAAGYGPYYQGRDAEYAWYTDSDSDGIVCES